MSFHKMLVLAVAMLAMLTARACYPDEDTAAAAAVILA